MGVIVDEHEELRCRDCGAPVTDEAIKVRIFTTVNPLRATADRREEIRRQIMEAQQAGSLNITLLGACTECGGGRFALRMGKQG